MIATLLGQMSSRDLGGGWVEATDRRTGRKYYANRKTKETRWTLPEELTCVATRRASRPRAAQGNAS